MQAYLPARTSFVVSLALRGRCGKEGRAFWKDHFFKTLKKTKVNDSCQNPVESKICMTVITYKKELHDLNIKIGTPLRFFQKVLLDL